MKNSMVNEEVILLAGDSAIKIVIMRISRKKRGTKHNITAKSLLYIRASEQASS